MLAEAWRSDADLVRALVNRRDVIGNTTYMPPDGIKYTVWMSLSTRTNPVRAMRRSFRVWLRTVDRPIGVPAQIEYLDTGVARYQELRHRGRARALPVLDGYYRHSTAMSHPGSPLTKIIRERLFLNSASIIWIYPLKSGTTGFVRRK